MSAAVPILLAVVSYALYATQAIVLEQKLSQYSAVAVLVQLYIAMLPIALIGLLFAKMGNEPIVWPKTSAWWIIGLAALVFFFADAFFVTAFTAAHKRGGDYLYVIVALGALYPVFASIGKYIWNGKLPNGWHISAYVLALVVVLLAAKGNAVMQMKKKIGESATDTIQVVQDDHEAL